MAQLTIYHYPQCISCRKAKAWLEDAGHELDVVHIVKETPDKETLRQLWQRSGEDLDKFFGTRSVAFREMNLKEKLPRMDDEEKLELLASNGKLLKRPIVTDGEKVTVGFSEKKFAEVWGR